MPSFLDRAKQYAGEKLSDAEKTPYDAEVTELLSHIDIIKEWSDKNLKKLEELVQPNPALRAETALNKKLDNKTVDRMSTIEHWGTIVESTGYNMKPFITEEDYKLYQLYGGAEVKVGECTREGLNSISEKVVTPLKEFIANKLGEVGKSRKTLESRRLDLDVSKNKCKKAKEADKAAAEASLAEQQTKFDVQTGETKQIAKTTIEEYTTLQKALLKEFLDLQIQHLKSSADVLTKLQEDVAF